MKHITIDYGIDLGTTNSAIARMNLGEPEIIRSDNGMETMPSCITFKKNGQLNVGFSAYSDLGNSRLRALKRNSAATSNACTEFKRFMGSDKTFAIGRDNSNWTPEQLSAQVLKTLCSFATDDVVRAAVVTVPAKFTVNQKDATLQAAHLAGIEQVELIQEPIAASMAYGLKAEEKNGIWMVFDFGGGTLDVALVHVADGIMQIFDTEGDNYLGGKNIDEAIVSKILLPELLSLFAIDISDPLKYSLLTEALKVEAEKLKKTLSYKDSATVTLEAGDWGEDSDGEEIEMELTVTKDEFERVVEPILRKAVDICKKLMERNNIPYGNLSHLILIGGPTYIPLLRKMLREEVSENVETSIDPMTAVAKGAAIYASTLPLSRELIATDEENSSNDINLEVGFEATTVDEEAYITIKPFEAIKDLHVKLIRRADGLESPLTPIGVKGALIIADLQPGVPNIFRLAAYVAEKPVACFPSEITIIQGSKAGSAILPYNIGIEVYNPKINKRVFTSLSGLEKNRTLPATGTVYGLKTLSDLFPGNLTSIIRIAIYQGDDKAEGKTADLFEYVSDVVVSGDEISTFIPEKSLVNVRIDVDRSEMMRVVCEFPESGQIIEKKLDTSKRQASKTEAYLRDVMDRTNSKIKTLQDKVEDSTDCNKLLSRLEALQHTLDAKGQHKQIEQHLKEILREIESYENDAETEYAMRRLDIIFQRFKIVVRSRQREDMDGLINYYKAQIERLRKNPDPQKADLLHKEIDDYIYELRKDEIYRDFIRWVQYDFSNFKWSDTAKAQALSIEGKKILEADAQAPLSKTQEIAETLNSLIISKPNQSSDSEGANPLMPNDILSI